MSPQCQSYSRLNLSGSGLLLSVILFSLGCGGGSEKTTPSTTDNSAPQHAEKTKTPLEAGSQNPSIEKQKESIPEPNSIAEIDNSPNTSTNRSKPKFEIIDSNLSEPKMLEVGSANPINSTTEQATIPEVDPDDPSDAEDNTEEEEKIAPPKEGTPEWLVRQMILLRIKPFPRDYKPDQLQAARRNRNIEIVKMAEEAIPQSLKTPNKPETFNAAVNQLISSRYQLALMGSQKEIEALYDVADVLFKKDPKSKVAADAAYAKAELAQSNAQTYFSDKKSIWPKEFARQALFFAENFPTQNSRAVQLLDAAGRICEYHQMTLDARQCYSTIEKKFAKSAQAKEVPPILRRLSLTGKILTEKQFGGPTLDGSHLSLKNYRNKATVIFFWSTETQNITEIMPKLVDLSAKYEKDGFSLIGVCLDENELGIDLFLEQYPIKWPQIMDPDPKKRGWNHPIVKYYGVRDIPMFWLLDRQGVLREMFTTPDPLLLETKISSLFKQKNLQQIGLGKNRSNIQRVGNKTSQPVKKQ